MIDLASHDEKQTSFMERAWGKFAWIDIPEKGQGICGVLATCFASWNFCGVGVVGLEARSDTFQAAADRLERNGGIY